MPQAIEEGLRWEAPLLDDRAHGDARRAIGGVDDPGGRARSVISIGAANRDDGAATEPERFDISREREAAHGVRVRRAHAASACTSRAWRARVVLDAILDRLPGLRLDPVAPVEITGMTFRARRACRWCGITPEPTRVRPSMAVLLVGSIALLGVPETSLGVLWPSMRADWDQPLSSLGILLFSLTGGYLVASLVHGKTVQRWGTASILSVAAVFGIVGAGVLTGAPTFAVGIAGYLLLGLAAGGIDSSMNAYAAIHHGPRLLTVMHGGFGVGATFGPPVVTAIVARDLSWRWAWLGVAGLYVLLLAGSLVMRSRFLPMGASAPMMEPDVPFTGESLDRGALATDPEHDPDDQDDPEDQDDRAARWRLVLGLSVASFFFYTGTEAAIGLSSFELLTERGLSVELAGLSVTCFWGALMVGRFSLGALFRWVPPRRALAFSVVAAVLATAMLWLVGARWPTLSPLLLVLTGLSLASVFPSLMALTPHRLGAHRAPSAIGVQLAAASLGVASVPAVVAVVADRAGIAAIGPAVTASAVLLACVHATAVVVERRVQVPVP